MKATLAQLKKLVQERVKNTNVELCLDNHYTVNAKQLKYVRSAVDIIIMDGETYPEERYTPTKRQVTALKKWVDGLEDTFVKGL